MNADAQATLVQAVQTNCDIADARHAADLTLCTYLLQMREFYRWESGLPFGATLPRDAVGAWIAEREDRWSSLQEQPFRPLPDAHGGATLDPVDVAAVNARLHGTGRVYGAGLAGRGQAVFFLAEAHPWPQHEGLPVLGAGRELARGLTAPPAVLDSRSDPPTIVLRREALARWCWEKFESFSLRPRRGSAFDAVVQAYGMERDFDAALERCVDEQCEALVLHELGEHRAGRSLDPGWSALRLALPTRRGELLARALRDHLADLSVTLPTLLARGRPAALHFWFASFDGLRQQLFPRLELAYQAWRDGDGGDALHRAAEQGHRHFLALARQALALHAERGDDGAAAAEALLAAPQAVCAWPDAG